MKNRLLWPLAVLSGLMSCVASCTKSDHPVPVINNITISSLKPVHGPYNTIDTITGSGFDKIPELDSILINGKKLTIISRTALQIIVQIPSLTGTGNV